jgi:hypothetical protein
MVFVSKTNIPKGIKGSNPFLSSSLWNDGRAVDCGSFENYCTERYLGFESLSFLQFMDGCPSGLRNYLGKVAYRKVS